MQSNYDEPLGLDCQILLHMEFSVTITLGG